MTVRTLMTLAMLAVPAFVIGCGGPDCDGLCAEMNACPGAVQADCAKLCSTDSLNEKAVCESQFDELWTCVDNRTDVCQAPYGCELRFDLYADCVAGYCINQPGDADCAAFGFAPAPPP